MMNTNIIDTSSAAPPMRIGGIRGLNIRSTGSVSARTPRMIGISQSGGRMYATTHEKMTDRKRISQ